MFDSSYPVIPLSISKNITSKYLIQTYQYRFDTDDNVRYLINIEEYPRNLFVIKFCPRDLKKYKYRYNILTKKGHLSKIIRTNINALREFYKKHPKAHFGFIGAKTYCPIEKTFIEDREITKRFRIYKYAVINLIDPNYFDHHDDELNNTYLLINTSETDPESVKEEAIRMFEECMN